MSDCCSTSCDSDGVPKTHRCPVNGKVYKAISLKTVLHQIAEPWCWDGLQDTYFFCDDPDCEVVYFAQDDSVIKKSDLRMPEGAKEGSKGALLCYCFGVSFHDAVENPEIRQFVIEQTKKGICACEIRNPSGKCCLKDFPKESGT